MMCPRGPLSAPGRCASCCRTSQPPRRAETGRAVRARTKYPRTPHLPWSPGCADDDRIISAESLRVLDALPTVITEKMDGGNITLMRDAMYARSVDSGTPVWETR